MSALLLAAAAASTSPPRAEAPCRRSEVARSLDFWVGDWDVYVGDTLAGRDQVEAKLDGCAIVEHWLGSGGDSGMSLFAFDARRDLWTQNWVTNDSSMPGGIKVKVLRGRSPGMTLFQGEIEGKTGGIYYDRTILTLEKGGRVRQQIEVSRDGVNWRSGFDALYVPHGVAL